MFGLMKSACADKTLAPAGLSRMIYCGSCKTIGGLYGASARMTLNHDAVFLGELVAALTGEERATASWGAAYQSRNCFSIPTDPDRMPISLRIAAAANLLIARFKVADGISDSGGFFWRLAGAWFAQSFQSASRQLEDWGMPLDALSQWVRVQDEREALPRVAGAPAAAIAFVTEPTARATGILFEHAARIAGVPQAAPGMERLGAAFGSLVYTLDAYEDHRKDARSGAFNALALAHGQAGQALGAVAVAESKDYLWQLADSVQSALGGLGLPARTVKRFRRRLHRNLSRRIGARFTGWMMEAKEPEGESAESGEPAPEESSGESGSPTEKGKRVPVEHRRSCSCCCCDDCGDTCCCEACDGCEGCCNCNTECHCGHCCGICEHCNVSTCESCAGCGECGSACHGCEGCCSGCEHCGSCAECCSGCEHCGSCLECCGQ